MASSSRIALLAALVSWGSPGAGRGDAPPTVDDPALEVTLFAEHPAIVTPVGVAVADDGRGFVVESHTHSPGRDYDGPDSDRVKVLVDTNGDGRADRVAVFADGFDDAMNLAIGRDGTLDVCHRAGVTRLRDLDGDGRADDRAEILRLETRQTYDHSGLLGICPAPDGRTLYVSRGNVGGFPYVIRGADGSEVAGYGDGGNVVVCDLDGGDVREVATGFWNPFAMAFDRHGRLLCVDNDPDSRGPNRLVHVIEGGDYGFRALYGPSGRHPYVAWDGELPGTLPIASGTEEAPSGLLACDRAALPASYRGHLLATSWGGHVVERFRPEPSGASIVAARGPWMEGGDRFRPVGIASGPDGAIYVTDWIRKDYPNHGEGRVWRISPKADAVVKPPRPRWSDPEPDPGSLAIARLLDADSPDDFDRLLAATSDDDPFLRSAAVTVLARPAFRDRVAAALVDDRAGARLAALLATRRADEEIDRHTLKRLLADPSEPVRLMALIRVGESGLDLPPGSLRAAVAGEDTSVRLAEVYLATLAMLRGDERRARLDRVPGFQIRRAPEHEPIAEVLRDETAPDRLRALAARLVPDPDREGVDAILIRLSRHGAPELRTEAVRTLARGSGPAVGDALLGIALDRGAPADLRADAFVGLARQPLDRLAAVAPLLSDPEPIVRIEAARALRPAASEPAVRSALTRALDAGDDRAGDGNGDGDGDGDGPLAEQLRFALGLPLAVPSPDSIDGWVSLLAEGGDPDAGRRVFLHPTVACSDCHRIEGRGGPIGPDLSGVGRSAAREQLIRSILDPSAEIAPEFQGSIIATADGQVIAGIQFHFRDGGRAVSMILQDGREIRLPLDAIDEYGPARESLMPEGLERQMTLTDFRNLLA